MTGGLSCALVIDELLRRNAEAPAPPTASARPTLQVAVLTCMDARIDPVALFGVRPGEVHVLRNAGAVVTDDMERSLAISQRKLGTTQVLVVAHTRCGMATFTDDEFAGELEAETGSRPQWPVHTFGDPAESVRAGVARLRQSPFLQPGAVVAGYVYDVDAGALTPIG